MRYSKDHKAETHARIVKNASVRLREKGPAGIGVAEPYRQFLEPFVRAYAG